MISTKRIRVFSYWVAFLCIVFLSIAIHDRFFTQRKAGHDYAAPIEFFEECVPYRFEIDSLPYDQLSNIAYRPDRLTDTTYPRDDDGVAMWEYEGKRYYHPVNICHRAYEFVAAYRHNGDSSYLDLARRSVDRLIGESADIDGALFYPNRFDFKVHHKDEAQQKAPWYSGMAQGEILGLLVRMFWATGDSLYMDYADKTFESLRRFHGQAEPWGTVVDECDCWWIDEYSLWPPSQTLNGFVYAVYGVYDYYLATGSPAAELHLQNYLSTVKNYIPLYRRPGKPSFYGLRFRHWSVGYHFVHIQQLRQLQRITGDEVFGQWADSLQQDFGY